MPVSCSSITRTPGEMQLTGRRQAQELVLIWQVKSRSNCQLSNALSNVLLVSCAVMVSVYF